MITTLGRSVSGPAPAPSPPPAAVPQASSAARRPRGAPLWTLLPLTTAVAVLLVAVGYAAGREQRPGAEAWFWAGQLLLIGSAAVAIARPRTTSTGRYVALFAFTAGQYAIKWAYSPLRVKFPDEMQHWVTAVGLLDTSRLLAPNHSLPVSPQYPGLEAVTVGVVRLSGLSLFAAACVVTLVSTLLLTGALTMLVRRLSSNWHLGSIVVLVYLCNPHHGYFTSLFLYATPALPLMVLTLVQAIDVATGHRPRQALLLGVLFGGATVMTHHVTALIMLGLLTLLACGASVVRRRERRRGGARQIDARGTWMLVLAVAGCAVAWVATVAAETPAYLRQPVTDVLDSVASTSERVESVDAQGAPRPLVELALSAVPVLLTGAVLGLAALWLWRARQRGRALVALAAAGLYGAVLMVRFAGADGQQIAGRAFAYLPIVAGAGALVALARPPRPLLRGRRSVIATGVGLVALGVGGIAAGIPAFWQRVPGVFRPSAFESAVDAHTIGAADWARTHLPPDGRVAADFGTMIQLGTIGGMDPVGTAGEVFYRAEYDERDAELLRALGTEYLALDWRATRQGAVTGKFFIEATSVHDPPPVATNVPMPSVGPERLLAMSDMDVVFDDGTIRILDMRGSRYGYY